MKNTINSLLQEYKRMVKGFDISISKAKVVKDISEVHLLKAKKYVLENVIQDLETFLS